MITTGPVLARGPLALSEALTVYEEWRGAGGTASGKGDQGPFTLAVRTGFATRVTDRLPLHQCPYCERRFASSEEVTDHVIHDHRHHVLSFLIVEPHDPSKR